MSIASSRHRCLPSDCSLNRIVHVCVVREDQELLIIIQEHSHVFCYSLALHLHTYCVFVLVLVAAVKRVSVLKGCIAAVLLSCRIGFVYCK